MVRGACAVALLSTVFAAGAALSGFSLAQDARRFLATASVADARITAIEQSGTGARAQRRFHFAFRLPDGTELTAPAWRPMNMAVPPLRVGDRVRVVHDIADPIRVQLDHPAAAYGTSRDWYLIAALCLAGAVAVAAGLFALHKRHRASTTR